MPLSKSLNTVSFSPLSPPVTSYGNFDLSIVIPVYNELPNLELLIENISSVLQNHSLTYEILFVDDGSRDGSTEFLRLKANEDNPIRSIIFRRNYGQTAAMAAGFRYAQGRVIIVMDSDLQNDPADIPKFLAKINEGYDLVSGWRKHRQDHTLTRLLPSQIANRLISWITGVHLHDYGCSLKAYRADLAKDLNLYGELHRFLPALAFIEGANITEIPVLHHPRRFGQSKYGLSRTFRVVMDLITIVFMKTFLTRPMHAFGFIGLGSILTGGALGTYLTYLKLILGHSIGDRPLLLLAILLFLAGLQMICFGLLAELLMRTYHESQGRPIYRIRDLSGFETAPEFFSAADR